MSSVRETGLEDACGIARVHVKSWKAAFATLLPDDYLERLSVEERHPWWMARLREAELSDEIVLVFADDDRLIKGFVSAFPCDRSGVGEIGAIYLDPDSWGRGIGRLLLQAALVELQKLDCAQVILWVHPENHRPVRFYERAGWKRENATKREDLGHQRSLGPLSDVPVVTGTLTTGRRPNFRSHECVIGYVAVLVEAINAP